MATVPGAHFQPTAIPGLPEIFFGSGSTLGTPLVVSGWKNKVGAAVVTKLPKTFAARVTAVVMARYRVSRMDP